MKQNITLSLERELLRKAKVLAARKGTSVSGLLAQYLERVLKEESAYERARKDALAVLARGFHLGGKILTSREEWHAR
ncbi:MAG TPA: DUF6364 family protein [Methylomirabilota bacterium]|jgi:hypothetical protein|nr:DUF6364 family protein [Methylomirabilota bacterium]